MKAYVNIIAATIVLFLCGCEVYSPISHKMVTSDGLIKDWDTFSAGEFKIQADSAAQIAKADDDLTAAKNALKSSFLNQVLTFLNDPQNAGAGVTIATALVTALIGGLHFNNLRMNRKISHPEIDDPATSKNKAGNNPAQPAPTVVLVNNTGYGAASLAAALAVAAGN